ncbi:MAG: long-chain-fatty-acid--CoA ligase [Candidatus Desulfacyla sp.]
MSVGAILRRNAFNDGDKTALVFEDRRMTYGELNRAVNRVADHLLKMGLEKGDRLAVLLHNGVEFIELYFACAKSGVVFVPLNNLLKARELVQILEYIKPRALVLDHDFVEMIQPILPGLPFIQFPICLGEETAGFSAYTGLTEGGSEQEPQTVLSDDDLVSIFLTSGTTGRPKGVMRTHRHDWINMMSCALEMGVRHDDRALLVFPFYHVTFVDNMRHLLMGNTTVIRREGKFDPHEILGILSREGITMCQLVPTMINALLQVEDFGAYDLSRFRLLIYAASPMPVELLKKAMKRLNCRFMQMYGQTETGPATTALRPEDHLLEGSEAQMARLASAGRAILDYEVRVVDEEGRDVAIGEVGELAVRSEAMTIGYWDLPEETGRAIQDGWLHTGDFGRLDEERYVFIVDRKNDMIISGGKNIYPREIEEVIYTHDAVLETAVIGIPDDYWGESVKALVVLKPGREATEAEIIALCKDTLASYKKPKSVEFRSQLPKSPTGKLLKRTIREEYWKGIKRNV